jgi:hypothetical protein
MLDRQTPLQQQQQRTGIYVSNNPNLADILDGEQGNFEVVYGSQAFTVGCKEGHSIASFVPAGQRTLWIIRPLQDAEPAIHAEQELRAKARGASA